MIYVSKPQRVEAIQWTGDNGQEILDAFGGVGGKVTIEQHRTGEEYHCGLLAGVDGAQDWLPVPVGHWIVHPPDDLSNIWPGEDEYFRAKYDPVDVESR